MKRTFALFVSSVVLAISSFSAAQVAVTTFHNDNYRSGSNTQETILTPGNVNVSQFGRLKVFNVTGYVYAQPLYVPNVDINGVMHNVVYIATEHDQVYAFDVNSGAQLWNKNLLITVNPLTLVTPVLSTDENCYDLVPEIGITGTPVIDVPNNVMFLVAKTKEHNLVTGTIQYFQTIYALDLRTGNLRTPLRRVAATYPGTGTGSQNGLLTFDPFLESQRPGLLLLNGTVYGTWASHCDNGNYHGWVIGYSELSLLPNGIWVDTPNAAQGGFWNGGSGAAADSGGSIYVASGNGTYDTNSDFGDSIVRLTPGAGRLTEADYFTPWDQLLLDENDTDVGSGGITLLPDQPGSQYPHLLVQAGKEGTIDLVNRDNMGHFHANNDDQIVQTLPFKIGGVWGAPAFWNNTAYFGGQEDHFKAFTFNPQTQLLSTNPTSESTQFFNYPGPTPSISSNGNSDGIAWIIQTDTYGGGAAVLHAYDATNLATELYNSNQNLTRDNPGLAVKMVTPTIADGHVFVGAENQVSMFGLLP
jgi:hypothetical protein